MLPDWYRHSPSSGNRYREAPDAFLWRYGFNRKEEKSAKMAVGNAVEFAAAQVLLGVLPNAGAIECALAEYDKQMEGEVSPERADIEALVPSVIEGLKALDRKLIGYQHRLTLNAGERYGLKYPVTAYTDFTFTDLTVDCKVTWRLPSEPKFSHVCQLGTYHALSNGKAQALLYVTPKKRTRMELPEADLKAGFACMLSAWRRIEGLAERFNRPEDALAVLPHNPDSYFWDEKSRKEAAQIWNFAA
jgi:hypothetical protein